jgi:hypothetical protein
MAKGQRTERPQPKEGQIFTKVFNNKKHTMKTVKEGAKIKFKVGNAVFSSPTGAAKHITQYSVNGWVFWGIEKKPAYHLKKDGK